MTSLIIILVSAIAIATLIGLNMWLGGWTASRIETVQEAAARLQQDFLSFNSAGGIVSAEGKAALVIDKDSDRIGLVLAQGDIFVSRIVDADSIAQIDAADGLLDIRFRDFTFPRAVLDLANPDAAIEWRNRLTGNPND